MDWGGSLEIKFPFAPESTKNRGRFRKAVHNVIQSEGVDFLLTGEVHVRWALFLDEEQRRRTDRYADCDNYVKTLNDAIKGPEGILIDDTQVQSLSVSWIDTRETEYFELVIESRIDDSLRKPLALYELADDLYYPATDEFAGHLIPLAEQTILRAVHVVNKIEAAGSPGDRRRWDILRMALPNLTGFHKSRVIDSGFPLYGRHEWESLFAAEIDQCKQWAADLGHPWFAPGPEGGLDQRPSRVLPRQDQVSKLREQTEVEGFPANDLL